MTYKNLFKRFNSLYVRYLRKILCFGENSADYAVFCSATCTEKLSAYFRFPDSMRYSPICTALSAAPLRI